MGKEFMLKSITYSDAIEEVMIENGGFASLKYIYENIEKYREKTGKTPDNTIQERVQKDVRFTRIAYGVYALTSFINDVEQENLGRFIFKDNRIIFDKKKEIIETEKNVNSKIRIGQNLFRNRLIKELKMCPITEINDKRLLIASHIKPWAYSSNEERLNSKNGFLLSPLYDKLFDKSIGLITFTADKEILISNRLSQGNKDKLMVQHRQVIKGLPIDGREEFIEFHNKFIFQG